MNTDEWVPLRTYQDEMTAEMALLELEASGIEAMLSADDCGGTYPMLRIGSGSRSMPWEW